jgi:hypothetical protein
MASIALVAALGTSTAGLTGGALTGAILTNLGLSVAGSILDQTVIFPALFPREAQDGQRVDDWPIGQSFEGAPMGWVDGTARIEGVPIYLGEPVEEEVTIGGGKAGPDSTQFRYKRDVVVLFSSDVPPQGGIITDLWINGERVFQLSPDINLASNQISATTSVNPGTNNSKPYAYLRVTSPPSVPNLALLQIGYPVTVSGFAHPGNNFTTGTDQFEVTLQQVFTDKQGNRIAVFAKQLFLAGDPNPFAAATAGPTITISQDLPQLVPDVAESLELYTGEQLQGADPYIEAAVGSGNVPSYEGLVCMRFGGLNMTRYGNGVAQYQAIVLTISPTNLGEHIGRVMKRAGIQAGLFDTFGMAGNFIGAVARGPQEASALLGTALQATNNVAAEVDGRLIFKRRPVLVDYELAADELGAVEVGQAIPAAPFPIDDAGPLSLPRAVTVQHMDPNLEYQTGAPRQFSPPGSEGEELKLSLRTWAMTRQDAAKAGWSAVWNAQSTRQSVRFTLPPSRRMIRPGHLVSLPVDGGAPLRVLIQERTAGINGILEFVGVVESPEVHLFTPAA